MTRTSFSPLPRRSLAGGLLDARGHRRFGERHVGARIVGFLVADLAVHPEHAVVVLEAMVGDRAREGVLHVGVDVHLHHAVVQRLVDVAQLRSGSAVEDQVESRRFAERGDDGLLAVLQDRRFQLDLARFVHAVHVAERGREQIARAWHCLQPPRDLQRVLRRRVELRGGARL